MIFTDIPTGASVFFDANIFVYYFSPHPTLATACTEVLERVERQDLIGFTSAQILSDVVHRLMTFEAMALFGWPQQGIANRLKRHPNEVKQLRRYRSALDEINLFRFQILPDTGRLVALAADVCGQTGLLNSDGLIVATMREHGLTHLASHDADFDRVPGITRYAPV